MSKQMTRTTTDKIILTQEGLADLQAELKELQEVKLPQVVARIANARDQGDLSENSDYHAALDEKAMLDTRIEQIEVALSKAEVVESKSSDEVSLGSRVKLQLVDKKKQFTYTLVGEYESDPSEGKVSVKSPIGQALLGKKKGEQSVVETPTGKVTYKILSIN